MIAYTLLVGYTQVMFMDIMKGFIVAVLWLLVGVVAELLCRITGETWLIVLGPFTWKVERSENRWIGICDGLALTVESATRNELVEDIENVQDRLFSDLNETGDLERFILERGLKVYGLRGRIVQPVFPPPALINNDGSAAPAYQ